VATALLQDLGAVHIDEILLHRYSLKEFKEGLQLKAAETNRLEKEVGGIYRPSDCEHVRSSASCMERGDTDDYELAEKEHESGSFEAIHMTTHDIPGESEQSTNLCFDLNTYVQGSHREFVRVDKLIEGSKVQGQFSMLTAQRVKVHPPREHTLVELDVGVAKLVVTPTHRIVGTIEQGKSITYRAQDLRGGEKILCSNGAVYEVKVRQFQRESEIVEIFFSPDAPVLAFDMAMVLHGTLTTILSKGQSRTRRGGTRYKNSVDQASIACTEEIWLEYEDIDGLLPGH
jgi:hypothetical protein